MLERPARGDRFATKPGQDGAKQREAGVSGSIHPTFGVPTLSRQDMDAEKLPADAHI